jgi:hypothetical protein
LALTAEKIACPRVLHIINSLSHRGGVMRGLFETLPRLNRMGGRHTILCLRETGPWARDFEAVGVRVLHDPRTRVGGWRQTRG